MSFTLGQAAIELTADPKAANAGIQSFLAGVQSKFAGFSAGIRGMFGGLGGLLGGIGLAVLAKDAMDAETAEHALAAALAATNQEVARNMELLNRQASAIQSVTTMDDDRAKQLMTLAINYGAAADQAGNLVKVAMGLGKAYGKDAETMLQALTKAQNGNTRALRMALPDLYAITDQTELMAVVNEKATTGWKQVQAETQTSAGAMKQAKNALLDVAESLWGAFSPAIIEAAKWIKDWANGVGQWVKNNQDLAFGIMKVGAALGGLIVFGPSVIGVIRGIAGALMFLAANPVGMIITAIGLCVYALYEWGLAGDTFGQKMEFLGVWLSHVWNVIKIGAENMWTSFLLGLSETWDDVQGFGEAVSDAFIALFTILGRATENMWTLLKNFGENIKNLGSAIWGWITSLGKEWKFSPTDLTKGMEDVFKDLPKGMKRDASETTKTLQKELKDGNAAMLKEDADYAKKKSDLQEKWSNKGISAGEMKALYDPWWNGDKVEDDPNSLKPITAKAGISKKKKDTDSKTEFVGLEDFWKKTQDAILNPKKDETTEAIKEGNEIQRQQLGKLESIDKKSDSSSNTAVMVD